MEAAMRYCCEKVVQEMENKCNTAHTPFSTSYFLSFSGCDIFFRKIKKNETARDIIINT